MGFKLFITLIFMVMSFSSFAVDVFQYSFSFDENQNIQFTNFKKDGQPSFEKFQSHADQFENYQEFLNYLEASYPTLFEQNVLIHKSGSLQFSSLTRPRVLMYGGSMVLSLDENPETDVRRVEIIQYDFETKTFSPKEIVFNPGSRPKFKSNPKACLSCHGKETKPIWLPYDFWPGSYGSHIGRTGNKNEQDAYHALFTESSDLIYPRLGNIERPKEDSKPTQINNIEGYTFFITNLNNLRISKKLKDANIGPYIYPVFAALGRCYQRNNDFSRFFPEQLYSSMPISFEQILNETTEARLWLKDFLQEIYDDIFGSTNELFPINHYRLEEEIQVVARLRFVLENIGINTRSLLMGRGINDYFFSTPSNFSHDMIAALAQDFKAEMLAVGARFPTTPRFPSWPSISCDKLEDFSKQALQNEQTPTSPTRIHYKRRGRDLAPIGRCIKCHSAKHHSRAPYIPFHKTEELRHLLKTTNLKSKIFDRIDHNEMPPRRPLNDEEKESVKEYLNTL